MKGFITVLIALLFTGFAARAGNPTYTLKEALKKKLVKVEIQGADTIAPGASSHYGKCLQIQLTNLTAQKFNVQLETGQQLLPDDSAIQTMIVTEQLLFVMGGNKKQKKYINAMCMQKNDGGPGKDVSFAMGMMSSGHLLGIAQLLEKHKYFDNTAQQAVWCISDNIPIESINSEDTVKLKILQEFVAKATGQKIPARGLGNTYKEPERHYTHKLQFEWTTHSEANTTLAVLDENNKPVEEILKEQMMPAGTHKYTIELSTRTLPKGVYTVILYINRKPFMQRRVTLGR